MSWSLPIFRIAGIQLRIHITFLLLIAWLAFGYYAQGGSAVAASRVIFVLLLFLCVVLHEFGHAFAAKAFGINTPDITLLPIGGLARLACHTTKLCACYTSRCERRPGFCLHFRIHRIALESISALHRAFCLYRCVSRSGPGADERCLAQVPGFQRDGTRISHSLGRCHLAGSSGCFACDFAARFSGR